MPKRARQLSAFDVRRIKKPGRYFVGGVAGLHLYWRSPKACSWVLRKPIGGKNRDIGLGSYAEVSLTQARQLARDLSAHVRSVEVFARAARHTEPLRACVDLRPLKR